MRAPRIRDIPPRATLLVVVLALLASVVTGAPWTSAPPPAALLVTEPAVGSGAPREPLQIESLERRTSAGVVPDLFKRQALPAPGGPTTVATIRTPPAVPIAPALPFKYLGRMSDGTRTVVFLESGQNLYSVALGDTVESVYRVDAISDSSIIFRYIPLGQTQTLSVPARP